MQTKVQVIFFTVENSPVCAILWCTQLTFVGNYRRFGNKISVPSSRVNLSKNNFSWNSFWNALKFKMGPIVSPEESITTNMRCVTSQKSADLMYTAAESWDHSVAEPLPYLEETKFYFSLHKYPPLNHMNLIFTFGPCILILSSIFIYPTHAQLDCSKRM